MKTLKIITCLILVLLNTACEEDVQNYDFEKYKFVSFIDDSATFFETYSAEAAEQGEEEGFPIYLQYDGSVLEEDFTVELQVTENFAQAGVDYEIESTSVLFKAGSVISEPFYIYTLDDLVNSLEDRSLNLDIVSVSNPKIDIGVGIVNQSNKSMVVNILDNECSSTTAIFTSQNIKNETPWGSYTVTGSVSGDVVTLTGDLIAYGPFPNAELGITLTPAVEGATSGTATFNDYNAGFDNDGYKYQFRQIGTGTYDVCSGEISVEFEVYYEWGGWVYWYTTNNTFSIND